MEDNKKVADTVNAPHFKKSSNKYININIMIIHTHTHTHTHTHP